MISRPRLPYLTPERKAMPKYRTQEVYYPPTINIGDGPLGHYINELRQAGLQAVVIKFVPRKEVDHSRETPVVEEEYTNVQGNVGSS